MQANLALEVKGLYKGFGSNADRVQVLENLDLKITQGAFDAVMGPSGSGKSTLLHLLSGLLSPDQGTIAIGGKEITNMDDQTMTCFRRRRIGLVFQDFNLIPTLNAEENIVLPLLLDRQTPDPQRVEALLEKLNLSKRRKHLPAKLSGGERQRVAIGRALVNTPEIILADEPTGNLDSPAGRSFCDLLQKMNQEEKCTILLVSHDPVVAATARQVHLLQAGSFVDTFTTQGDPALVSYHYLKTMQS